jgi:D-alanine-D-alanine ligase
MRVVVLVGGQSNEREVSLKSGQAVYDALVRKGFKAEVFDPGAGTPNTSDRLPPGPLWMIRSSTVLNSDVVFVALHGGSGENGQVQCLLDLAGKRYTGSGMLASAIAMNKALTKRLMTMVDVITPKHALYRVADKGDLQRIGAEVLDRFGLPLIVKPNDGGSTIGLTKVSESGQIDQALEGCFLESREILVETFIAGRELTVAVLDGEPLPVVEIRPKEGLYDYVAKYTKGKSEYLVPAPITDEQSASMQQDAAKLYDLLGCKGVVRVDFVMDQSGTGYCLEVNTSPGMTELSLVPMAARESGMSFDDLVERLVQLATKQ